MFSVVISVQDSLLSPDSRYGMSCVETVWEI